MDRATASQLNVSKVVFAIVAVLVFVVDRISKALVNVYVTPGSESQILPHVWITNTSNSGAAFSIAPNATFFFTVASVLVAGGLIYYVARNSISVGAAALLGLVLGGTVGNGWDRLHDGTVTDFISVRFWPVFNVADAAISVGVVLLLAGYLIRQRAG